MVIMDVEKKGFSTSMMVMIGFHSYPYYTFCIVPRSKRARINQAVWVSERHYDSPVRVKEKAEKHSTETTTQKHSQLR